MKNTVSNYEEFAIRLSEGNLCCRQKYVGRFRKGLVVLNFHDIYYFESYKRVTHVYTGSGSFRVSGSLEKELEKLPKSCFVLIHQNYLVNFSHVIRINGKGLTLSNGKNLEISGGRSQAVHERFQKYLKTICLCTETGESCYGY